MNGRRILVVDHRDSFVFNLVDDLRRLGATVDVVRSSCGLEQLDALLQRTDPHLVLLSPGPGHPADAGVFLPLLARRGSVPVLGVCLGLQAMVIALGGSVGPAPVPVHGRATRVRHDGHALFDGVPSGFGAGRYHSLVATRLPRGLEAVAWTESDGQVMAVAHQRLPWLGLQFHPESVLTPGGPTILSNALRSLAS